MKAQVNPKSTSNQSSKPCTVLQYPSKKGATSNTGFTSESVLKRKQRESERKRDIDAMLEEKTAQVRKYVPKLKHKKPIRRWVALFTRSRGQLIQVTEVLEV